jgi:hypothetical protein
METEDAGLHMIGFIRRDMGMDETRIILRTGQPGYAPSCRSSTTTTSTTTAPRAS